MFEQAEQRLKQLRAEFQEGQKMLADLENKVTNLKTSLLRISGAIQVLEELLEVPAKELKMVTAGENYSGMEPD